MSLGGSIESLARNKSLSHKRTIALLGIGHTNAHVVRQWANHPIADCRLVCISKFPFTTYSGMLPGALASQFEPKEIEIQLGPLAQRADAELMLGEVVGLDVPKGLLLFADREPLAFDALSIGVGSMPAGWKKFDSPALIPIKPMQTFLERLDKRLEECDSSPRCVVVGGGVAGVEIALCLHARLAAGPTRPAASVVLVTAGEELVSGMTSRSRRKLSHLLSQHAIEVVKNFRVSQVNHSSVEDKHGNCQPADVIIWATGAAPPPLLAKLGLATDERGFLATNTFLQTTTGTNIFAVGDTGTIESNPAPKAGVFAVRQAPVLWHNLQATFDSSRPMKEFIPQGNFLKILNTGQGKALLEYRGWTFHAHWCWWLKRRIDKTFVGQYQ